MNDLVRKDNDLESSIVSLLGRQDLDLDKMNKLLDVQERIMYKRSESEYSQAMSKFQGECPVITKNKKVNFVSKSGKTTKYNYASLDEIVSVIKPILKNNNLYFSFEIENRERVMDVSVLISHIGGHTKKYTATFPSIGDDERMNDFQRVKSAITYSKRVVLENALGIVSEEEDDDAVSLNNRTTTQDQSKKSGDITQRADNSDEITKAIEKIRSELSRVCEEMKTKEEKGKFLLETFGISNFNDFKKYDLEKLQGVLSKLNKLPESNL